MKLWEPYNENRLSLRIENLCDEIKKETGCKKNDAAAGVNPVIISKYKFKSLCKKHRVKEALIIQILKIKYASTEHCDHSKTNLENGMNICVQCGKRVNRISRVGRDY